MNDNYDGIIVSKTKGRKIIVLIFIIFSPLRLVIESRNIDIDKLNSGGNQFNVVIVPFSPPEGLKGHLFYVTNLSPIYVHLTCWSPCREAAGNGGWV